MVVRLPSASELQRATACTASVVLDQIEDTESSAAARRGSLIGAVIASELRGWDKPDVGRHRFKINMAALRTFLGEGDVLCELAMSLRPNGSVEDLGENIGRAYNRPGCINGAADIVVVRKHALVIDVKTGTYPVPQPADNWQVAALSSMVPMIRGVESVTGVIAKLGRDGEWDFGEPHRWSRAELYDTRARLLGYVKKWRNAQLLRSAGFAEPERVPGEGCFFCKARCEHGRLAQREAA